ncbi:MAG: PDZ domain-containing protein [Alphaproteobacteria bacterium]|nr:PDZ domain-containing protein [Alphaproteobacteria bacterium]
MNKDVAEGLGLPNTNGALIANVSPGGPAQRGGIQDGDFVLAFDGKPVADSRALSRAVADTPINKTVNVDLWRNGKKMTVRVTVLRLNEKQAPAPAKPPAKQPQVKMVLAGLSLAQLDSDARGQFHIGGNVQGVLVTDVKADSPAAETNIRPGDVILQVQGNPVRTPDDVAKHLAYARKVGKRVAILVVSRGNETTYVAMKLS